MRTPAQIQSWLDANQFKMDLPSQYLGTEPNAYRKPWDTASVRWLLCASWPYEQAAGNSSIPAVYKCVNDGSPQFLADRFYLPATPRDLRMLERDGIPVFGIESKHQLADFDVVGSSISYPVLSMSYLKMLTMSGIPPRWRDRDAAPESYPMVIVGGQCYGAPEVLAPVVDCWWLGEVEDEPGNPGIAAVSAAIARYKATGAWQSDRVGCYLALARTFRFLYFPRFVDIHYDYERRPHIHDGPGLSKQVVGYSTDIPGIRLPLTKRIVKNLDNVAPLDNPPLLFADPAMGSGDLEVGRGCPAWCSFPLDGAEEFITQAGVKTLRDVIGEQFEVWTPGGWAKAEVEAHGLHPVQEIVFRPADCGTRTYNWRASPRAARRVRVIATPCHGWELVSGEMTHDLKIGDVIPAAATFGVSHPVGYAHGFLFGDAHQRHTSTGERRPANSGSFTVRLFGGKADMLPHFERLNRADSRASWRFAEGITVSSVTRPPSANGDPVVHGWASFNVKTWPPADASAAYLRGFLAGWLRADGSLRPKSGSYSLSAQRSPQHGDTSPTEWLERYAASAGWILVGGSACDKLTNLGKRAAPLVRHTLVQARGHGWRVESIAPLAEKRDVYCLAVPGVHRFALATGLATGNCALTYRQKPYRQRSVDNVVAYAKAMQNNMGAVRMAPFSPDFPMYTRRKKLIAELLSKVSDEVDAPTMRVDDFIADSDFILLQVHGGMDAVTLGVEGNSQRMRDLLGKGVADADIKEAVTRGIRAGIRKFKLFMISNLPGEDAGDICRIVALARDLADIRESMHQPTVRIQFSWTPLMVEAQTPMQWFAPPPAARIVGDVLDQMRNLKIEFKLGSKAQPDKMAFFQLCQRASRDVGEALVDAMLEANQATWGGFPRTFKALIEAKLVAHGFHNGFHDCFDERFEDDFFGWEHIDQGISTDLLWKTYLQMREFAELTDSDSYDTSFTGDYHGAEWVQRCDERCYGKSCGVCDHTDLRIRQRYLTQLDEDIDLTTLSPVDQRTQALRIRARLDKPAKYRFVGNDHWRFNLRRAAFRAQQALELDASIAKRSIRFASDQIRAKDWVCGTDYVEFAMTRPMAMPDIDEFMAALDTELGDWMSIDAWGLRTARSPALRTDLSLYDLDIDDDPATVTGRLAAWQAATNVPMQLKVVGGYFAPATETVNAKQLVDDLWLIHDGHRLRLRMLIRGRPSPYNVYAALMGRASWLDAAAATAQRLDTFIETDRRQQDFFRPTCVDCGLLVPINVLDEPWSADRCPRCTDEHAALVWRPS